MRAILALAVKDVRLLLRQRAALFWVLGWPLITSTLFGVAFSGPPDAGKKMRPQVALVDQDKSAGSIDFIGQLNKLADIDATRDEQQLRDDVRSGRRSSAVVLPSGFGAASRQLFYGDSPQVLLLVDPSRRAERAMLEGLLHQAASARLSAQLSGGPASREWMHDARGDAAQLPPLQRQSFERFFDALDGMFAAQAATAAPTSPTASAAGSATQWQPLQTRVEEIEAAQRGPKNAFAITFPQGLLWGIVGCVMTFASALALEQTQGTLVRLRASPLSSTAILAGKAIACAACIVVLCSALMLIARLGFRVIPVSPGLLLIAIVASAVAFTGLMMFIASFGTTVQSVSGAGWAMMMPMMLFGGGMIPLAFMPPWMSGVGSVSPVKWAISALEGAIWRGYSFEEMLKPFGILIAIGVIAFLLGALLSNINTSAGFEGASTGYCPHNPAGRCASGAPLTQGGCSGRYASLNNDYGAPNGGLKTPKCMHASRCGCAMRCAPSLGVPTTSADPAQIPPGTGPAHASGIAGAVAG